MIISDEERDERIELIGTYVLQTGDSTRKTAEYFSKNFFLISNATVSSYCRKFIIRHKLDQAKIEEIISINKSKKLSDVEIKERIYKSAKDVLNGLTIEEISEKENTPYWTVYRDLTDGLKQFDGDLYKEIKLIFNKRRMGNLKK